MAVYDDYVFHDLKWYYAGSTQIGNYYYTLREVPGYLTWERLSLSAGTIITISLRRAIYDMGLVAPFGVQVQGQLSGVSIPFRIVTLDLVDGETTVQSENVTIAYDEQAHTVTISILQNLSWISVDIPACPRFNLNDCVVRCQVVDKTQESYDPPLSKIPYRGMVVNNMDECFRGCDSLITSPPIPDGVESVASCFRGCTSLERAPVIPDSVQFVNNCFRDCTSLTGDICVCGSSMNDYSDCFAGTTKPIYLRSVGNKNTELLTQLAGTANNNNVLINVHPESPITFADAQMDYMTEQGLVPLSLQTNANLVQCDVPDLVNGGTITTNVNDALIDLYNRDAIGGGA